MRTRFLTVAVPNPELLFFAATCCLLGQQLKKQGGRQYWDAAERIQNEQILVTLYQLRRAAADGQLQELIVFGVSASAYFLGKLNQRCGGKELPKNCSRCSRVA